MRRNLYLLLFLFWGCLSSFAQTMTIRGLIVDREQSPIINETIICTQDSTQRSISNIDGLFELNHIKKGDTLRVSHFLYESLSIPIISLQPQDTIKIILTEKSQSLDEVVVRGVVPIARRFSASKMTEMDIYQNPIAQGDPLKAITGLAASTSTSEMANPEFRGSPAGYATVTLNKVPIDNPVRYSQLNNQGLFSLFHPSMIDTQWVYPSNPPITMGRTLSGLVDIRTKERMYRNSTYFSLGIGGVGAVLSRKLSNEENFVQLYSNVQFSDAMLALSPSSYPEVKSFYSTDLGINLRVKLLPSLALNVYAYGIGDKFTGESGDMNYFGSVGMGRTRFFNVLNLKHTHPRLGITMLNVGYDTNKSHTEMGNLDITEIRQNSYVSLDHKILLRTVEVEGGLSWSPYNYKIAGKMPLHRYLREGSNPQIPVEQSTYYGSADGYLYAYTPLQKNLIDVSFGIRAISPLNKDQRVHLSYQGLLKFHLSKSHKLLFGGGHYVSFASPNTYTGNSALLKSRQANVDYEYIQRQRSFKMSVYWKKEDLRFLSYDGGYTPQLVALPSWGGEVSWEDELASYWSYNLSLTAQKRKSLTSDFGIERTEEWTYFGKSVIQYNNPRYLDVSLAYSMHKGNFISRIDNGTYIRSLDGYVPTLISTHRLPHYHRLDFSVSKRFPLGNSMLNVFMTISNLLNQRNIRSYYYSPDYNEHHALYLQLRNVYFGCVLIL